MTWWLIVDSAMKMKSCVAQPKKRCDVFSIGGTKTMESPHKLYSRHQKTKESTHTHKTSVLWNSRAYTKHAKIRLTTFKNVLRKWSYVVVKHVIVVKRNAPRDWRFQVNHYVKDRTHEHS